MIIYTFRQFSRICVALAVSCFANLGVFAFDDFPIKHLQTEEGLSLIGCVVRDNNGFLWVGNHNLGVFRYDGYEIKKFAHAADDPTSLSNQLVQCMIVDDQGKLWIGTK